MKLFDLFRFSKLIKFEEGELSLMNTYVNILPSSILADLQKSLIENEGYEKAYFKIYDSAKEGAVKYNKEFIKKQGFNDKRKILNWQLKLVTLSGWGKAEASKVDFKKNEHTILFYDSPFPKSYGKEKFCIDIITTAFVAGGASATAGMDLDALETKCIAKKDAFCKIEIGKPEIIKEKRDKLWAKLGLI